jgi:hypothetical protein
MAVYTVKTNKIIYQGTDFQQAQLAVAQAKTNNENGFMLEMICPLGIPMGRFVEKF